MGPTVLGAAAVGRGCAGSKLSDRLPPDGHHARQAVHKADEGLAASISKTQHPNISFEKHLRSPFLMGADAQVIICAFNNRLMQLISDYCHLFHKQVSKGKNSVSRDPHQWEGDHGLLESLGD